MEVDTVALLEAHRIAHQTWQDVRSMYEEGEVDLENAALLTAAYTVASRLAEKALLAAPPDRSAARGLDDAHPFAP